MRKTRLSMVAAAAAALALVLGVPAAASAAPTQASNQITIGYINHIASIPYIAIVQKGMEAAAKKAGVKLIVCNPEGDAAKTVDCAAQFKTQNVDGIISFNPVEAASARACAAGPQVPVIAIDIVQQPCQTVFYGANNAAAGSIAGRLLGQHAKANFDCNIDAFISMEAPVVGVVNEQRMGGFKKGYEGVCGPLGDKLIRVDGKGATDTSIQPCRDTLTRLAGKKKIYVGGLNDDMVIGCIKAAESAGRLGDIYGAGQGADPTSLPYMCGKTNFKNWIGDAAYFPENYGADVIPTMISLIEGQKQPKTVNVRHRAVTPANVKSIYPNACK